MIDALEQKKSLDQISPLNNWRENNTKVVQNNFLGYIYIYKFAISLLS